MREKRAEKVDCARAGGGGEFSRSIHVRVARNPPNLLNNQALGRFRESPLPRLGDYPLNCLRSCPDCRLIHRPEGHIHRSSPMNFLRNLPGCSADCPPSWFPRCPVRCSASCSTGRSDHRGPSRRPRCSPRRSDRCSHDCPQNRFPGCSWNCSIRCRADCRGNSCRLTIGRFGWADSGQGDRVRRRAAGGYCALRQLLQLRSQGGGHLCESGVVLAASLPDGLSQRRDT